MPLIVQWFTAFLWTLGVELLVASIVLRGRAPLPQRLLLIVLANVATHPAVWLIFPEVGASLSWPGAMTLAVSELWAFGFEAFVYLLYLGAQQKRAGLLASLVANAASLALGYLLRAVGIL